MPGSRFFDSNILIYAFAKGDPRSERAATLLADGGVINVQVLNEFANVSRRKLRWEWPAIESALAVIADLLEPPRALTVDVHRHAVVLARDHQLSFYDALIVAAAAGAECTELFTEDLQHGQRFGALRITDPFR